VTTVYRSLLRGIVILLLVVLFLLVFLLLVNYALLTFTAYDSTIDVNSQ